MKLAGKLLSMVDRLAIVIGFVGVCLLVLGLTSKAVVLTLKEAARDFDHMWNNGSDRAVIIVFLASIGWCALRWKAINRRGG